MGTPTSGAVRGVRASVLGLASVALAATGHGLGHGQVPGLAALLVVAVPVGAVAVLTTGRRVKPAVLVTLLAAEQSLLHHTFMLLGSTGCDLNGGSLHANAAAAAPLSCHGAMTTMAATSGSGMLFAHALATLLTAWLLARGESLAWRVTRRAFTPKVPAIVLVLLARAVGAGSARVATVVSAVVTSPGSPRGPPRVTARAAV